MHHVIIKSQGQDVQPLILRIGIFFVTSVHQFIFTNLQIFFNEIWCYDSLFLMLWNAFWGPLAKVGWFQFRKKMNILIKKELCIVVNWPDMGSQKLFTRSYNEFQSWPFFNRSDSVDENKLMKKQHSFWFVTTEVHSGQKCLPRVACLWSKTNMFQRAGMREEGKPLPLAFQYLILMIWRPCDLELVMISSMAAKCQDFEIVFNFIS